MDTYCVGIGIVMLNRYRLISFYKIKKFFCSNSLQKNHIYGGEAQVYTFGDIMYLSTSFWTTKDICLEAKYSKGGPGQTKIMQ